MSLLYTGGYRVREFMHLDSRLMGWPRKRVEQR
jgi:hypothetical protein